MSLLNCKGPDKVMEILSLLFDASVLKVTVPPVKLSKEHGKIHVVLPVTRVTSRTLDKLLGYLGYASKA